MSGFKITRGRGFHVTFENGWTVSVQFGPYNYCDGYPYTEPEDEPKGGWANATAEVAAWPEGGDLVQLSSGDTVAGHQTPAQVLALMVEIAAKPSPTPEEQHSKKEGASHPDDAWNEGRASGYRTPAQPTPQQDQGA